MSGENLNLEEAALPKFNEKLTEARKAKESMSIGAFRATEEYAALVKELQEYHSIETDWYGAQPLDLSSVELECQGWS